MDDATKVFDAWRARQDNPARFKFNTIREALISVRLESHTAEELIALINYAYEADTNETARWHGRNTRGTKYLGLDNLLRKGKLPGRIKRATAWAEEGDPLDLDLGPMAAFRGQSVVASTDVDRNGDQLTSQALEGLTPGKPPRKSRGRVPKRRWGHG